MRAINKIILHWPADTKATLAKYPGGSLRDHYRHIHKRKGWSDIGYHYVIHNGKCFDGRPDSRIGAHTYGYNSDSIGVTVAYPMDGHLSKPNFDATAQLLADLSAAYGIELSRSTVFGHRDFMANQCPGDELYLRLDELITPAKAIKGGKMPHGQDVGESEPEKETDIIKIDFKGQEIEALLINSQSFIHISKLEQFGFKVSYDKEKHRVKIE